MLHYFLIYITEATFLIITGAFEVCLLEPEGLLLSRINQAYLQASTFCIGITVSMLLLSFTLTETPEN